MALPRRHREVHHAIHPNLVPDNFQVLTLVDLNFVGDHSRTERFVMGILQVPAGLILLHEPGKGFLIDSFCQRLLVMDQPHLEVFDSVPIFIFGRPLPRDDVSAFGRKH